MTEMLRALLKKTFVDNDVKSEVQNIQETNLRHAIATNTLFDYPYKWLLEEEIENQCIDWVLHYLLSKEFPDLWATKISVATKERALSDRNKLKEMRVDQDGMKRTAADRLEDYIIDVLQKIGRTLYDELDSGKCSWIGRDVTDNAKDVSIHAIKNTRRKMEDKHVVLKHFSELFGLKKQFSFYGVFDGHGGIEAAKFSSAQLPGLLAEFLNDLDAADSKPLDRETRVARGSNDLNCLADRSSHLCPRSLPEESGISCDSLKNFELNDGRIQAENWQSGHRETHEGMPDGPHAVPGLTRDVGEHSGRVRAAFEKSFLETDRLFCEKAKIHNNGSGCTAMCLLIEEGNEFHVAWAGDSQALLVRGGRPIEIMKPHRPEREDEKARITALGGTVVHFGTWRVNGAISVSRAIGDSSYKPYITSQPDVGSYSIQSEDEYFVLACDGLWDVFSYDDVIGQVRNHLTNEGKDRKSTAQALVKAAKDKGSSDNITVMIVFLKEDFPTVSKYKNNQFQNSDGNSQSDKSGDGCGKENPGRSGSGGRGEQDGKSGAKQDALINEVSKLSLKTSGGAVMLSQNETKTAVENLAVNATLSFVQLAFEENETARPGLEIPQEVISAAVNATSRSEGRESSPMASGGAATSESTNNDSKKNYLESSSEVTLDLEFSPLKYDVKGQQDAGSICSLKTRAKRSPKISSSTEDKEDKENINLHYKTCLKTAAAGQGCSDKNKEATDVVEDPRSVWEQKSSMAFKRELKDTNVGTKDQTLVLSPDSKDPGQKFRAFFFNKQHLHQRIPGNLQPQKLVAGARDCPNKLQFASSSTVSMGFLKDSHRKFSQASSHLKKLDSSTLSNKSANNFGNCSTPENFVKGWNVHREKWTIAVETGEDFEDMFECIDRDGAGLNVSSTRW